MVTVRVHVTYNTISDRYVSEATQKMDCVGIVIQNGESNDKLEN